MAAGVSPVTTIRAYFESDSGTRRQLQDGEALFHDGDPVRQMGFVLEGMVRLLRHTAGGVPVVLQAAGPGDVIAEASAYSVNYHCGAISHGQTRLIVQPVSVFRAALLADAALAEAWAAQLAHAVQRARTRAELRTLRTVADRLDAWLGENRTLPDRGQWQALAAELGVSREALYRELAVRRTRG